MKAAPEAPVDHGSQLEKVSRVAARIRVIGAAYEQALIQEHLDRGLQERKASSTVELPAGAEDQVREVRLRLAHREEVELYLMEFPRHEPPPFNEGLLRVRPL